MVLLLDITSNPIPQELISYLKDEYKYEDIIRVCIDYAPELMHDYIVKNIHRFESVWVSAKADGDPIVRRIIKDLEILSVQEIQYEAKVFDEMDILEDKVITFYKHYVDCLFFDEKLDYVRNELNKI